MAHSTATDSDQQLPHQLSFAWEVDNEVKASDKRINNAHMIQSSISTDVYNQKLIGIPRHKLNNMATLTQDAIQPYREWNPVLPNSCSSVSDQTRKLVNNYVTVVDNTPENIGGFIYSSDDEHRPPKSPVSFNPKIKM
jgi:hypothetical protein